MATNTAPMRCDSDEGAFLPAEDPLPASVVGFGNLIKPGDNVTVQKNQDGTVTLTNLLCRILA